MARILQAFPDCFGVLAEQPAVLQASKDLFERAQLQGRYELVPTDFFVSVPEACDAYLLKSILHDRDDTGCGRILRVICAAMSPDSRLLIIERTLPVLARDNPETVWMDLLMMCVTGGQERFLAEYEALLDQSGLRLLRATPLGSSFQVLEVFKR